MPVEAVPIETTVPYGAGSSDAVVFGAAPSGGPADEDARPDPYFHGTDETMVLDLREIREFAARERDGGGSGVSTRGGSEPNAYRGSHRRAARSSEAADGATLLYADGGTAIPLDRVREVCHDLRQPVAAILMLASAAETRPDVPEAVRLALQEITEQAEDISSAVRQFLDDSKRGVDGLGDPHPVDVAALADECVQRWRSTYQGSITIAGDQGALHVTVDPVLFRRALGNVLSNATRAAGVGGRVAVQIRRAGPKAVIVVEDSGPGFGRIPPGHGLGLTVVQRTVGAAGGTAEFADGSLGGARITLTMPTTAHATRAIAADRLYESGSFDILPESDEAYSSPANRDFALAATDASLKSLALAALAQFGDAGDGDDGAAAFADAAFTDGGFVDDGFLDDDDFLDDEDEIAMRVAVGIRASQAPTQQLSRSESLAALERYRASRTEPVRVPAAVPAANRPQLAMNAVQLSLLPGGAF